MSRIRPLIPTALIGPALLMALVACSEVLPDPTPVPTTFPASPPEEARALAASYLEAWGRGDYEAMHELLAPPSRERWGIEEFGTLHGEFWEMAEVTELAATTGEPRLVALPPAPRPEDLPPPTPTPAPTAAANSPAGETSAPPADPPADPRATLPGPVPGLGVPAELTFASDRFGQIDVERDLPMTHGPDGWQIHWSPRVLFPELGDGGSFRLERSLGPRGDIVGTDGTVWATTNDDRIRVYPQEWLAGQTIGYASPVSAEDLERLAEQGYRAGDIVGRSGLENGAEQLLRGTPGWRLTAIDEAGTETVLYEREMVPGATLTITLRPTLQLAAHDGLLPYAAAATAAIDPATGDVWALASVPAFNPNAMTLGTTLAGEALAPPGGSEIFNKAILSAYPAGSSLKTFTLAAALHIGVVTPASRVTCPPTWPYSSDFTVRNYEQHSLPGEVSLAEAMAFSCNTTYMPLAVEVYRADPEALTDVLREFGFGQPSGIAYLIEETGVLPDEAWLRENYEAGFREFDNMQLAIGQGFFLATPLQLANAYAAVGNGGTLWVPRIVVRATLPDGTVIESLEPEAARQVSVSEANLDYVTEALRAVVTLPYGTGTGAFAGFGIPVAGKSGTAETGTPDPHAWFPAFAPADQPSISVATVLANIRLGTGGTDAAPLVRRVMAAHFAN
jgi:cell division protein FtsI/penicillin-binding protein 2